MCDGTRNSVAGRERTSFRITVWGVESGVEHIWWGRGKGGGVGEWWLVGESDKCVHGKNETRITCRIK